MVKRSVATSCAIARAAGANQLAFVQCDVEQIFPVSAAADEELFRTNRTQRSQASARLQLSARLFLLR